MTEPQALADEDLAVSGTTGEFYEGGFSQAVLLDGHWKGIRLKSPAAAIQLYDLAADPAESIDLAKSQPKLVERIGAIMRAAHVDNEHWKWPAGLRKPGV